MDADQGFASKVGIVLGDGQYHSAVARGFELEVLILRSFRKPDPLATRYRAVVLTASKHGVLFLRQGPGRV